MSVLLDSYKKFDFMLHDFVRTSWVSDNAYKIWNKQLSDIIDAWLSIICLSITNDKSEDYLFQIVPPFQYLKLKSKLFFQGLSIEILEICGVSQILNLHSPIKIMDSNTFNYFVVMGPRDKIMFIKDAWKKASPKERYQLLKYPECCAHFWENQSDDLYDPIWPMALNTTNHQVLSNENNTHVIEINPAYQSNILLRWLGLHIVHYPPCSFDCCSTIDQVEKYIQLGKKAGYLDEMNSLIEMLSWPVEWTAYHGIAVIKTPVVKFCATTDAAIDKYIVRYKGNTYPEEGVIGLNFPYNFKQQLNEF